MIKIITDLYDRGVKYSEDSKYAITLQNAKQILNVLAQEIYITFFSIRINVDTNSLLMANTSD